MVRNKLGPGHGNGLSEVVQIVDHLQRDDVIPVGAAVADPPNGLQIGIEGMVIVPCQTGGVFDDETSLVRAINKLEQFLESPKRG